MICRNLDIYQDSVFLRICSFLMFYLTRFVFFIVSLLFPVHALFAQVNCEVLRSVTVCEIVNDRLITTDTVLVQINKRSGETYVEEIKLFYNQDNPVTNLSAWLEDENGHLIRTLKAREITVANAVSSVFYSDYFSKTFTLKHSEYPYRICYTYKKTFKNFISINNWNPVLDVSVPTREAILVLKHPADYKVKILQQNVAGCDSFSQEQVVTKIWKSSYDGRFTEEKYSPDPIRMLPNVQIVPLHFKYGSAGSFESWQSFGEWQQRLIEGIDEILPQEKLVVQKLIEGESDKKEQAKKLYHYLQDHTRYIDVFIDIGGLKPYPASYVSENHFGDCKALTIYMKALLKAIGIKSYYVLLNAGVQPTQIITGFPSQQFNHVILAVPVENDTIWLENTSSYNPFGYLGTFTQNRPGLWINGSESRLVHIPALNDHEVRDYGCMHFTLNDEGYAQADFEMKMGGYAFEYFREIIAHANYDTQNNDVHDFFPFPSFELEAWKFFQTDRDSQHLVLNARLKIDHFSKSLGKESYFSIYQLQFPSFEVPAKRRLPVQIPFPVHKTDTIIYRLPGDRSLISELKSKEFSCNFGKYSIQYVTEGQDLKIYRDFQLYPAMIPIDEYGSFYEFMSKIGNEEKNKIVYQ